MRILLRSTFCVFGVALLSICAQSQISGPATNPTGFAWGTGSSQYPSWPDLGRGFLQYNPTSNTSSIQLTGQSSPSIVLQRTDKANKELFTNNIDVNDNGEFVFHSFFRTTNISGPVFLGYGTRNGRIGQETNSGQPILVSSGANGPGAGMITLPYYGLGWYDLIKDEYADNSDESMSPTAILTGTGGMRFYTGFGSSMQSRMIINERGQVGIGMDFETQSFNGNHFAVGGNTALLGNTCIKCTDSKGAALAVNGLILATEVLVKHKSDIGWPDYVFAPSYQLRSLGEVERFVKANKHLPEVPSAEQVSAQGVNLSEMNATLLKKVEELTLYLIEQDKQMKAQAEAMKAQAARIEKLEQAKP